jgi:diaminopimelate decarboxylase
MTTDTVDSVAATDTAANGYDAAVLSDEAARLLVHRAGATPVYAYSRDVLRDRVALVRESSPTGALIYYSLKANPHPGVVNTLASSVDGFDVCSTAELETALNAGTDPRAVLFTGPAKSAAEAATALAAGVGVTVESLGQARLLARVAEQIGAPGRAVLRINTPYPAHDPGQPADPNQFGLAEADVPQALALLAGAPVRIEGLHLFWGSQHFDAAAVTAARAGVLDTARRLAERTGLVLEKVMIGGGIGLSWCDGDPEVDWPGLRRAARTAPAPSFPGPDPAIVCEYGRAVVGPAGTLLASVLDVKDVDGRRYVLVDAGLNHAMIASRLIAGGRRGEPRVRVIGPRDPGPVRRTWVTGPLCSRLDVLAEDVLLPEVEPGDLLAFADLGAYGPTFSPAGFLSRDPAREVVY